MGTTNDATTYADDGLHRVTWDSGHPTFHCDAPSDARCRNYPGCGCEEWADDHEHPSIPQAECWMMPWLNENGVGFSYDEGDGSDYIVPEFDGPIVTNWEGDWLSWLYAPDTVLVRRPQGARPALL